MESQFNFTPSAIQYLKNNINPGNFYKDYKIIKQIGSGAYSKVYLAEANNQDSFHQEEYNQIQVALKLLPYEFTHHPQLHELYKQEVNLLKKIHSDNVVRLVDSFYDQPKYMVIVYEYCEGGTLKDLMLKKPQSQQYFTEEEAKKYFLQIYSGLNQLHIFKILHRDLKLENILISNGVVKISDFGFAKEMNHITNTYLGSEDTMAPEILEEKDYVKSGFKIDVYSLGIILYQMVEGGQHPFFKDSRGQNPLDLAKKVKEKTESPKCQLEFPIKQNIISADFKDLIYKMVQYDPSKRIEWQEILKHAAIVSDLNQGSMLRSHIELEDLSWMRLKQIDLQPKEAKCSEQQIKEMNQSDYEQRVLLSQSGNKSLNELKNPGIVGAEATITKKRSKKQQIDELTISKVKKILEKFKNRNAIVTAFVKLQYQFSMYDANAPMIQQLILKKLMYYNQQLKNYAESECENHLYQEEMNAHKDYQTTMEFITVNIELLKLSEINQCEQIQFYIQKKKLANDIIQIINQVDIANATFEKFFQSELAQFYNFIQTKANLSQYLQLYLGYLILISMCQDAIIYKLENDQGFSAEFQFLTDPNIQYSENTIKTQINLLINNFTCIKNVAKIYK